MFKTLASKGGKRLTARVTGGITGLTGDVTATGPGSAVATLAASGAAAGTYGDATHVPQIVIDAKGRILSASDVAIAGGSGSLAYFAAQCTVNTNGTANVPVACTGAAITIPAGTYVVWGQVAIQISGADSYCYVDIYDGSAIQASAQNDLKVAISTVGYAGTAPIVMTFVGSTTLMLRFATGLGGVSSVALATASSHPTTGIFALAVGGAPIGNGIYSTAVGSEPGTPNTGDADLYTNGAGPIARYSGSGWPTWGPTFAFTNPISGDFSWDNQGGASIDTTNGGVYLLAPTGGSDNIRYRYKAAPSTPYTIIIGFIPQLFGVDFQAVGFAWSDGTKFVCANFAANATTSMALSVNKFSNVTTFSADYLSPVTYSQGTSMAWLKCQDNGTNRIVSWSNDSQHWVQLHSVGRTDFLTATRVGFFANSNNATWPAALTVVSWLQA